MYQQSLQPLRMAISEDATREMMMLDKTHQHCTAATGQSTRTLSIRGKTLVSVRRDLKTKRTLRGIKSIAIRLCWCQR